ncbi:sodium ion-translocating decarboxylase subunit beta [Desulfobacterium sp. N47]|uniref:Glutaconyl-CoA decarboxylase subunit beta n=1 Tax=uncultured Desulfobacterium sp. TaxID=201089 RepID=E1YA80_9BACT|nr:Glutaconyl-CoA decarboxylase subunit beta [uncultured Desulfobacterium sp.]
MADSFPLLNQIILNTGFLHIQVGHVIMWIVAFIFIYLAIKKGFEPLLLLPIGFGILIVNLPLAPIMGISQGAEGPQRDLIRWFYDFGVATEIIPCLIFMGVGALTDFGPMIANPKTLILGAAAQFGVYVAFFGAIIFGFSLKEAASIGIIGGADGPTCIYLTAKLAPHLLGANALAAYSYMAMVPLIQPPIMRLLTTEKERKIKMKQMRPVSKTEKIVFPLVGAIVICMLVPPAAPLMAMLFLGNLFRESGVVERLNHAAQNELLNIVTIFLGVAVGATMAAEKFLKPQPIFIFVLGLAAFAFSTVGGILIAKLMNLFLKEKINPLIGSAGVSAVPMAARVAQVEGQKADKHNFLLMHAMGPNIAGVIGTAIAAGLFLTMLK